MDVRHRAGHEQCGLPVKSRLSTSFMGWLSGGTGGVVLCGCGGGGRRAGGVVGCGASIGVAGMLRPRGCPACSPWCGPEYPSAEAGHPAPGQATAKPVVEPDCWCRLSGWCCRPVAGRARRDRRSMPLRPAAIGPEQALAHLAQLAVGAVGIVEHALHFRIDVRRRPWTRHHHGDAEADGIGGRASGPGWSSRAVGSTRKPDHAGCREIDGADAGDFHQRPAPD